MSYTPGGFTINHRLNMWGGAVMLNAGAGYDFDDDAVVRVGTSFEF